MLYPIKTYLLPNNTIVRSKYIMIFPLRYESFKDHRYNALVKNKLPCLIVVILDPIEPVAHVTVSALKIQ